MALLDGGARGLDFSSLMYKGTHGAGSGQRSPGGGWQEVGGMGSPQRGWWVPRMLGSSGRMQAAPGQLAWGRKNDQPCRCGVR